MDNRIISYSDDPIVLRTDFTNDREWEVICNEIQTPEPNLGFIAYVAFLSDNSFEGFSEKDLVADNIQGYFHDFIFIVDDETVSHQEHPILCVGLNKNKGLKLRTIPSEMWGIENNLSISNMDFEDFSNAVDNDGIFRGFKE